MKKFFVSVAMMALSAISINAAVVKVVSDYRFGNEDATNAEFKRFPGIYDALMKVKEGDKIVFTIKSVASEDDCVDGAYLAIKDNWKEIVAYEAEELTEGAQIEFEIKEYQNSKGKTIMSPSDFNKSENAVAISGRGIIADISIDIADATEPATYNDMDGETTVYYNPEGLPLTWSLFCMFDQCHFKNLEMGGQLVIELKDVDNSNPDAPAQVAIQDHTNWATFISNDENALTTNPKILVPIIDNTMTWTVDDETALYNLQGDIVEFYDFDQGCELKGQSCSVTRISIRSKALADGIGSIESINGIKADDNIYNIQGQMVGSSLDRLQKGIYIHNGKTILRK